MRNVVSPYFLLIIRKVDRKEKSWKMRVRNDGESKSHSVMEMDKGKFPARK
jgi:hypothetical protein